MNAVKSDLFSGSKYIFLQVKIIRRQALNVSVEGGNKLRVQNTKWQIL